jgi:acetyl/propionyl-CoA carboxylase alpha subunit
MIAKLIVWGENRDAAVRLLQVALNEFEVEGIQTNIPFLKRLTAHPDYVRGDVNTAFVPNFLSESAVVA